MSILTMADYASSVKQVIHMNKLVLAYGSAGMWSSGWADAGAGSDPSAAGSFTLTSTASGAVPTNSSTGAPTINNFSGVGYISKAESTFSGQSGAQMMIVDRLFECGSFAFASGLFTLSSQPSYSGRIPSGDYSGTLLALEQGATSGAGPASVTITYTNQSGVAGQTTGSYTVKSNAGSVGGSGLQFVPLAAGDSGVQKVESVTATGGSSGNINVIVIRPLVRFGVNDHFSISNPQSTVKGLEYTGMRIVYPTSCLMVIGNMVFSGTLDATIEIVSG